MKEYFTPSEIGKYNLAKYSKECLNYQRAQNRSDRQMSAFAIVAALKELHKFKNSKLCDFDEEIIDSAFAELCFLASCYADLGIDALLDIDIVKVAIQINKKRFEETGFQIYLDRLMQLGVYDGTDIPQSLDESFFESNIYDIAICSVVLGHYDVIENDDGEILISVNHVFVRPERKPVVFMGKKHAILLRDGENIVICDALHPHIAQVLPLKYHVLFFEPKNDIEFLAPVLHNDSVDSVAEKVMQIRKTEYNETHFSRETSPPNLIFGTYFFNADFGVPYFDVAQMSAKFAKLSEEMFNRFNYTYSTSGDKYTVCFPSQTHIDRMVLSRFGAFGKDVSSAHSYKFLEKCDPCEINIEISKTENSYILTAPITDNPVTESDYSAASRIAGLMNSTLYASRVPGFIYFDLCERKLIYKHHLHYNEGLVTAGDVSYLLSSQFEYIINCRNVTKKLCAFLSQPPMFMRELDKAFDLFNSLCENSESAPAKQVSLEEKSNFKLRKSKKTKYLEVLSKFISKETNEDTLALSPEKCEQIDAFKVSVLFPGHVEAECDFNIIVEYATQVNIIVECTSKSFRVTSNQYDFLAEYLNFINCCTLNGAFIIDERTNEVKFRYVFYAITEPTDKMLNNILRVSGGVFAELFKWLTQTEPTEQNHSSKIISLLTGASLHFADKSGYFAGYAGDQPYYKNDELWFADESYYYNFLKSKQFLYFRMVYCFENNVPETDDKETLYEAINYVNSNFRNFDDPESLVGGFTLNSDSEKCIYYEYLCPIEGRYINFYSMKAIFDAFYNRVAKAKPIAELLLLPEVSLEDIKSKIASLSDFTITNKSATERQINLAKYVAQNYVSAIKKVSFSHEINDNEPDVIKVTADLKLAYSFAEAQLYLDVKNEFLTMKIYFTLKDGFFADKKSPSDDESDLDQAKNKDKDSINSATSSNENGIVGYFTYEIDVKMMCLNLMFPYCYEHLSEEFFDKYIKYAFNEIEHFYGG